MKETLSIRHGEMLVEVLGMELGDIWQRLINFVLWGEPDKHKDLRGYRLFWAWKAIVMLQAWDKVKCAWDLPDQITAEILGWEYKKVWDSMPKSDQLTVTYSHDTWLAYTIYGIVEAFIKQSGLPYAKNDKHKPALEPGKWYWNIQADCPAFLRSYVNGAPRVLMPVVQTDDGPSLKDEENLYTLKYWTDALVEYDVLRSVLVSPGELDY